MVFASRAWIAVAAVATQSLLAWLLGPADRGAYAVCVMFGSVFGVLFGMGCDRGAQYYVMSGKLSLQRAVSVMLAVCGVGAVIGAIVGVVLLDTPLEFFEKAERSSFLIALFLIPATMFATAFRLQLAGLRQFSLMAKVDVTRSTTNLVLLALFLAVFDYRVNGALGAQLICLATAVAISLSSLWRNDGLRLVRISIADVQKIVGYGRRYYIARIGHVVDAALGTVLLAFLAGQVELGLFAAASALTLSLLTIADSVEVVLLPRIAADAAGRPELVASVARLSGAATGVFVLLLVAASTPVVRLLLSPDFIEVVPLIYWLAPGVILQGFNIILMSFFRGNGYPGVCSWTVWIGLVTNAIGLLVLYPMVGVASAAIALSLGFFARTLTLCLVFCRLNDISLISLIRPAADDLRLVRRMADQARSSISRRTRKGSQ